MNNLEQAVRYITTPHGEVFVSLDDLLLGLESFACHHDEQEDEWTAALLRQVAEVLGEAMVRREA